MHIIQKIPPHLPFPKGGIIPLFGNLSCPTFISVRWGKEKKEIREFPLRKGGGRVGL
jgi:hypothetical protein